MPNFHKCSMSNKVIISLIYISLVNCSPAPTHLLLTRAGPCSDTTKTVITVSELSLSTHTYESLLSGEFNISQEIDNGWTMKATMLKCVDIRNLDSCDHFRSFSLVKNGCSDEDEDEQELYEMLFHYANPKLECPIQSGHYKIVNYPLFTEDNYLAVYESKISTSIFGYTFRLDGFSVDDRKVFCLEAQLQLMYMRQHEWVENAGIQETTEATARADHRSAQDEILEEQEDFQ